MKNMDYNSLLMYISLILAVAILVSILFGCSYKNKSYREYFNTENTPGSDSSSHTGPAGTDGPAKSAGTAGPAKSAGPATSPNPDASLTPQELQIKNKIKGGEIDEKILQKFVDSKQVSTENLQNIIESFQKELNLH